MGKIKFATGAILIATIIMLSILTTLIIILAATVNRNVMASGEAVTAARLNNQVRALLSSVNVELVQRNLQNSDIFFVDTKIPNNPIYINCTYNTNNATCNANLTSSNPKDLSTIFRENININNSINFNISQTRYIPSGQTATYTIRLEYTLNQQTKYRAINFNKSCPAFIPASNLMANIAHRLDPTLSNIPNLKMRPLSSSEIRRLGNNINRNYPNLYCTCDLNGIATPLLSDGSCLVCQAGFYLIADLNGSTPNYICHECPTGGTCNNNQVTCANDMIAVIDQNNSTSCACLSASQYYNRDLSRCMNCPGYLTGSGINTTCNNCPTYATCNPAINPRDFTCPQGFTKGTNSCSCPNGYITGQGATAVCNACPPYATCNGTTSFNCPAGFTRMGDTCACPGGLISGNGINATCNACPNYGICDGSSQFLCSAYFQPSYDPPPSCVVCPAATYSTTPSNGCIASTYVDGCADYEKDKDGCANCQAGYMKLSSSVCWPCFYGMYSSYPGTMCLFNTTPDCAIKSRTANTCEKCDNRDLFEQDGYYLHEGQCYKCPIGSSIFHRCQCPDGINVSKDGVLWHGYRWLERRSPNDQDYWDNNCSG